MLNVRSVGCRAINGGNKGFSFVLIQFNHQTDRRATTPPHVQTLEPWENTLMSTVVSVRRPMVDGGAL